MKKVGLLFPHQLYKESEIINSCDKVYIIEDELYFGQYRFHKQKLLLHRASMKYYADFVSNNGWVNSKTNGKMRLEGKDYIVKDGDVLNFRFNT